MNNKKIIFHVTWQYMKRNCGRTAVTFTGIALMVMLMTCVFVGKDTAIHYMENVAALHAGSWHLTVYDIRAEEMPVIRGIDETDRLGFVKRQGFTDFPASGSEERPYLEVKGYSPASFDLLGIHVTRGRLPEKENEIVITETALKDGASIAIGDVIEAKFFDRSVTGINPDISESVFPYFGLTLPYGETLRVPLDFPYYAENPDFRQNKDYKGTGGSYTVVGFIAAPYFESSGSAGYPALTFLPDGALPADGETFNAVMTFRSTDAVTPVKNRIQNSTPCTTEVNNTVLAFSANGSDSVISAVTVFVEVFFVVLIMAASLILIYNVFQMSYRERTKYLGMLSSVGATGRQKRCSVYFEAIGLLLPALPVGMLLGVGVVRGGMTLLRPNLDRLIQTFQVAVFESVPVTLSVNPANLLLVAGMSFVTVLLSALLPAVKMGRIGPVESIRGNEGKSGKPYSTRSSLLRGDRAEALLAVCGTTRRTHLTRGIVRSIAAFGVLTAVTLYGAQSVIRMVDTKLGTNAFVYNIKGYDYVLSGDRSFEDLYNGAKERIEHDSAVTDTKEFLDFFGNSMMKGSGFSDEYRKAYEEILRLYVPSDEEYVQETLSSLDEYPSLFRMLYLGDEDFRKLAAAGHADMSIVNDEKQPAALLYSKVELSTDNMIFSQSKPDYRFIEVKNAFSCGIGEKFPLVLFYPNAEEEEADEVDVPLTVAGILDEAALAPYFTVHSELPTVILNKAAADSIMQMYDGVDREYSLYDLILLFRLKEGEGGTLLRELSHLSETNDGHIYPMRFDMLNTVGFEGAIVSIIRILAYCFTALIAAVCLLNLYHSVKGRAIERRREIAMLRSMGMTGGQMRKMLAIENLLLLAKGWCVAAAVSGGFILLLNRVIIYRIGRITLPVPWGLMLGITAAVGAALALTTFLCYRFTEKQTIIEDIRNETV